jgi:LAO/AO transport system kinase
VAASLTRVGRLLSGDVRALARAMSAVEGGSSSEAAETLQAVYPRTGRADVIGVTGAPGSGKSTLIGRLVAAFRGRGRRVGVVAVDPSSAFSGGAILGDRVRMQEHATDPDVFIRSMATRGHLGGLARATSDVVDLLDAAGFDPILVETVGVGQDEVEIVRTADAVAVVLVPGMGDDIQALKAGILEIADLFVINKAEREGADRLQADLEAMLALAPAGTSRPPIHRTVAARGEVVEPLADALTALLLSGGPRRATRRRERARARLLTLLGERLLERVGDEALTARALDRLIDDIAERRMDPYTAVQGILERVRVEGR